MEKIDSHPLAWPAGWKRTLPQLRRGARFSKGEREYSSAPGGGSWMRKRQVTVADGCDRIMAALRKMGFNSWNVVVSTNVPTSRSGMPRSSAREPEDPGAAVYWRKDDADRRNCMAIDQYDRVADNLAAIAATLEAMAAIERHGGAEILNRAFTGFTALPGPGQTSRGWRSVFGWPEGENVSRMALEGAYRTARSENHPDKGGSAEAFQEVQRAYEQAKAELGMA